MQQSVAQWSLQPVVVRWTPPSDQLEAKLSYGAGVDAGLVFLALVFKIELRRFANLGR